MSPVLPPTELDKLPIALRAIRDSVGLGSKEILYGFAGIILKSCAGMTDVATIAQTDQRTRVRAIRGLQLNGGKDNPDATITVSAGQRAPFGRMWLRKKDGKGWRRTHDSGFRALNQHYKRGDWIDLVETIGTVTRAIERELPLGRGAAALARQSWVQIADSLGIRLEDVKGGGRLSAAGIEKARKARASNGGAYENGLSQVETRQRGFMLKLINRYPRGQTLGFDRTLSWALTSQVRYFEKNLDLGVFNSISQTLRAYPFLKAHYQN